jgi:hypothetical protein
MKTCVASRYVFEAEGPPAFARRFEPVGDDDSGWCLMSGHAGEDAPDFGDEPANWRRNSLAEMSALFPQLARIWEAPVDTELEWDAAANEYRLADSA